MITLLLLSRWVAVLPTRWYDYDFNHYYVGSRMLLEGQNPYTTSLEGMSRALGFKFTEQLVVAGYPPSFLWLLVPLALLPPWGAFAVWVSVEIGCLLLILRLTRRLLGGRLSPRAWLFVAALTITSRTVTYHLLFSQVQLLLAALVFAAYAAHRAGKHGWACLAVSAAGVLKFYPFLLLPWFIWSGGGGMRRRVYRALGAIGFILAVVALTGPSLWLDFVHRGMPAAVGQEIGRTFNYSLSAMVTNLGYAYHGFHPSRDAAQWWWAVGAVTGLAVMAGAYYGCVVAQRDPEAQFCLLCTAMLIGNVTTQGHYFVFLVFPLAVAAIRIAAKPTPMLVVGFILVMLALNWINPPDFFRWHSVWYVFVNDIPLYGLIAVAVFFWRQLIPGEIHGEYRAPRTALTKLG